MNPTIHYYLILAFQGYQAAVLFAADRANEATDKETRRDWCDRVDFCLDNLTEPTLANRGSEWTN